MNENLQTEHFQAYIFDPQFTEATIVDVTFVIFKLGEAIFKQWYQIAFVTVFRVTLLNPGNIIIPVVQRVVTGVRANCFFKRPRIEQKKIV